ncbi:MAG: VWA domain-containing protein [Phycisphaerales bacterium]
MIGFEQAMWLLVGVPLLAALGWWRLPGRLMTVLRAVVIVLVVLGMSGMKVRLPSRAGMVVMVVDRSRSMPADSEGRLTEAVRLVAGARKSSDALAVVSMGQGAATEQIGEGGQFSGFTSAAPGSGEGSNYAAGLEKALSLIGPDQPGRILVVGDGKWTGRDPMDQAGRAAARGIAIDYRLMERPAVGDAAIERMIGPDEVNEGEGFMIAAQVRSPVKQEVLYELVRDNRVLSRGRKVIVAGQDRLVFRDEAKVALGGGVLRYRLTITPGEQDPVPENNTAKLLVGVNGPKAVLHVAERGDSGLGRLLRAGKMDVRTMTAERADWSLEALANYSGVILENVPAERVGEANLGTIAQWVKQAGNGVMMTGGRSGFGVGGYYKSAIEPVLPVSMELRKEHRKLAMAIVVALDRSGSMAASVGGGLAKIDLANRATEEVIDMMSEMDQAGVLAVDSIAHVVADLQPVTNKAAITSRVRGIRSEGGGIFIYEALSKAMGMLSKSDLMTRHVILFADAADSEEPGDYVDLLAKAKAAGITVSVVGLGRPTDSDAELLRDIAKRGDGRMFFTDNPSELPRLFAQDTMVVARSTFVDQPTTVALTAELAGITTRPMTLDPQTNAVGGYNLTYLRDGAGLSGKTVDEYGAPLIAQWQAGAGRAVVYTGEADGKYTGAIARWKDMGALMTSLARWTAGARQMLPGGAVLTQTLRDGVVRVTLHLDPARQGEPFEKLPVVTTLRGVAGRPPEVSHQAMRWTGVDELEAVVEPVGEETVLNAVDMAGRTTAMAPVTLPYSPEYQPGDDRRGVVTLRAMAAGTGGASRDVLGDVWGELPTRARWIDLSPWLYSLALTVLLAEIFERRSGLLAMRGDARSRKKALKQAETQADEKPNRPRKTSPATTETPAETSTENMLGAMRAAQQRARGRTRR